MRLAAALVLVAFASEAAAGPRKVLVLPIDGTADAPTRTKLTASVQKLARVIEGSVQSGDTTFAEAAAAVGCDPATPTCAETVRTTLGVDELVYGTATAQNGNVTVVVKRKVKDRAPKQLSATVASKAPAKAEPTLLPLFSDAIDDVPEPEPQPEPEPVVTPSPQPDPKPEPAVEPKPLPPLVNPPKRVSRERNLAIASIAGGSAVLLAGVALWSSASSMQDDIDRASADDLDDIRALRELEDRAASRALFGNICVAAGLGLGVLGGYLLYKDREKRSLTVTPAPTPGGVTLLIEGLL
jgi:hypothetical protein